MVTREKLEAALLSDLVRVEIQTPASLHSAERMSRYAAPVETDANVRCRFRNQIDIQVGDYVRLDDVGKVEGTVLAIRDGFADVRLEQDNWHILGVGGVYKFSTQFLIRFPRPGEAVFIKDGVMQTAGGVIIHSNGAELSSMDTIDTAPNKPAPLMAELEIDAVAGTIHPTAVAKDGTMVRQPAIAGLYDGITSAQCLQVWEAMQRDQTMVELTIPESSLDQLDEVIIPASSIGMVTVKRRAVLTETQLAAAKYLHSERLHILAENAEAKRKASAVSVLSPIDPDDL